jgi:hypothetical protein
MFPAIGWTGAFTEGPKDHKYLVSSFAGKTGLIGPLQPISLCSLAPCSLLWTVRSIYDLRRMPYGWRRCEKSYNSVDAQKADCQKTFPGRFTTNHSIVCSQNVPKCFRSDHRTISSTLLCFDEEVGRLLSLAVAPVTLANDGICISRSVFSSP